MILPPELITIVIIVLHPLRLVNMHRGFSVCISTFTFQKRNPSRYFHDLSHLKILHGHLSRALMLFLVLTFNGCSAYHSRGFQNLLLLFWASQEGPF